MLPTIQSRTTSAVFDPSGRVRGVELKLYVHAPRFMTAEHLVLEASHNGITTSLSLSTEDASWLGHALLSAKDDALRLGGPDYPDSPAGSERIIDSDYPDAGDRAWSERKDASARHSVMDPRD